MCMSSGSGFGGADAGHDLGYHGDVAARGARVDFAVNVRGATPRWLADGLVPHLGDLAAYPDPALDRRVRELIGARHGRPADEVLLLAGVAEGFSLLPELTRRPAIVHPQFTEPEAALRAAGIAVARVVLREPWDLAQIREGAMPGAGAESTPDGGAALTPGGGAASIPGGGAASIPDDADMLIVGNPTNPTSVLHSREDVLALLRPGRLLVVDEAFMDVVADGPRRDSEVAPVRDERLLVFRSLTKTWALAGLRCGYALGAPDVLARLARRRPAWPVGTLQLRAMELVATHGMDDGMDSADPADPHGGPLGEERRAIASESSAMVAALEAAGWRVHPAAGPFVLARPPVDGGPTAVEEVRLRLADRGIAVRRCDTFPGLDAGRWRLAVRGAADVGTLVNEVTRINTERNQR